MDIEKNAVRQQNRKYGFLFKTSKLRKARLEELILTDEFIKVADNAIANGIELTDVEIYNIAKGLFFPLLKQHLSEGFKDTYKAQYGAKAYKEWSHRYRIFGQATKSFSLDIFGDEKHWEKDFQIFDKT